MATEAVTTGTPRRRRLGRLERSAIEGVLAREIINFSSFWRATTFSSIVQPAIYLIAFGFGFGSLVSKVGGRDYVQYVGTGTVATPVDTEELVTAEALWIGARSGAYGCMPLLVAIVFGLDPSWGMLTVPIIGFAAGFGWACFGILTAAGVEVD